VPVSAAPDFFHYQDAARRRTSLLVACYILAVVLIIAAVYLAFIAVFMGLQLKTGGGFDVHNLWQPPIFIRVAGSTVAVVLAGTIYKIIQLGGGGAVVAAMLGGRPIDPGTADLQERKILNVVEEMAIASGTPVPRVFLLEEEEGVNAFAAGFSPADAVIGVTRGCIARLNRDELQGVIAHEFSHILNGDMRLNIRLIGILNGILVIALIGYWILRGLGRSRSSRGKGGGGMAAAALFGFLLMVIGYIGVFFAKLIKSAVSRQREYLADASAVQFTRNPSGIANALKKIGGFVAGSRITHSHAEEASHFFFADGLAHAWFNLLATHPPLEERIRRLDPQFDGDFHDLAAQEAAQMEEEPETAAAQFASRGGRELALKPGAMIARIGAPTPAHLAYAASLRAGLPGRLDGLLREPAGACAVIYALLLGADEAIRRGQLDGLARNAGGDVPERMASMLPLLAEIKPEARLPAAELAVATLKHLSAEDYSRFVENLNQLIKADQRMDLFEYTIWRMVMRRLAPVFQKMKPPVVRYSDLAPLRPAAAQLLSCLAYWGADGPAAAQKAFLAGMEELGGAAPPMLPVDQSGLQALDAALAQFSEASHSVKRTILAACTACIAADGMVTIAEAELLRAVGDALDCPIPPFLPGEKIAGA